MLTSSQNCAVLLPPPPASFDLRRRCAAPEALRDGFSYDVSLSVRGVLATYRLGTWTFDAPSVVSVTPGELPPVPGPASMSGTLTIIGENFGAHPGMVSLGNRTLECPQWAHGQLTCVSPPGVLALVSLVVKASSTLSSRGGPTVSVAYRAPAVSSVAVVLTEEGGSASTEPGGGPGGASVTVPTTGGQLLAVSGRHFAVGSPAVPQPVNVSVWLVQRLVLPSPPWAAAQLAADGWPLALRCPLAPGPAAAATSEALLCAVPPGSGAGWSLVVVNHDVDTGGSLSAWGWRASAPAPGFQLHYEVPTLAAVVAALPAPATGGFSVTLVGAGFSSWPPLVTVGSLPCVVLPGSHNHTAAVCLAPPLQLDAGRNVTVNVHRQTAPNLPSHIVWYDPPAVTAVVPMVLEASAPAAGGARTGVTISGVNFGVRYRPGLPGDHVVNIGYGRLPRLHPSCVVWAAQTFTAQWVQGAVYVFFDAAPYACVAHVCADRCPAPACPGILTASLLAHWLETLRLARTISV